MLVEFTVSNFLSISNPTTLQMVATHRNELHSSNTFDPDVLAIPALVNSAVLYGPNAAGKSNFIRAMGKMKTIVLESANQRKSGNALEIKPFLLGEKFRNEPSEFDVTFVSNGIRFQYGFKADGSRVFEEWLFAYPKGRAQKWIERTYDAKKDVYRWGGMDKLVGKKQMWQSATRPDALFLSTAIQLNNEQLAPVSEWFRETLHVIGFGSTDPGFTAKSCAEDSECNAIVNFLKEADINIEDIDVDQKDFDPRMLPDSMPEALKVELEKDLKDKVLFTVHTGHKSESGEIVFFELEDESDGTKKLFSLAGPWLDTLKYGNVLFVDELHDSLHPLIVRYLTKLFHDKDSNKKNAQLIFSTHDTSILSQDIFRRDQIWFCEKDESQSTQLFPLTDFKPRKEYENLERGYLTGRYGALPYLR